MRKAIRPLCDGRAEAVGLDVAVFLGLLSRQALREGSEAHLKVAILVGGYKLCAGILQ